MPDLSANRKLAELRLNGNRIARVPDSLATNRQLRLLDLGSNRIAEWKHTGPMHDMELHNVTLAGNPLCGVPAAPQTEEEREQETEEERDARKQAVRPQPHTHTHRDMHRHAPMPVAAWPFSLRPA